MPIANTKNYGAEHYAARMAELGSAAEVARECGVNVRTVTRSLARLARHGQGMMPTPYQNPPGYLTGKITVNARADGTVIQEWRHAHPDMESMSEFVAGLCEDVRGKGAIKTKAPAHVAEDLMLELPIYDAHIGKYAWAAECGAGQDWDTDLGTRIYATGADMVLARSPKVREALVVFGGDYFHADSRSNQTEASKHALDVDTRYARNIRAGAKLAKHLVESAAKRAATVRVVVLRGNHSWHSEHWLAMVLDAYYDNEPRVQVVDDPAPRTYHTWGSVLLGLAHGDRIKPRDLPQMMSVERPQSWAQTQYRHWHLGHIHKAHAFQPVSVDSNVGCVVEYLPSLTSTDAWHSEQGYINPQRVIETFVWHRDYGLANRITTPYQQIIAAIKG